jgi:predicted AAA+ superfamily ATPase
VRLCAARTGQLLNLSALANDSGISHSTARQWLTVLEASYLVFPLRPYHANFGKRLVKSPKLYFLDAGLAAALLGIKDVDSLSIHAQRGALFETLIVSEFVKQRFNDGRPAELFFWRDNTGNEVDLLFETSVGLQPIEIKSGATFVRDWTKRLHRWSRLAGEQVQTPWLIYGGAEAYRREGIELIPWYRAGQGHKTD